MKRIIFLFSLVVTFNACTDGPKKGNDSNGTDSSQIVAEVVKTEFNEDSAYQFVKKQVDFGPRMPGSKGYFNCYQYLVKYFKGLADSVYLQTTTAKTYDGKTIPVNNIIASFNPKAGKRILLCAHWDTRPFADQDTKDKDKPILGANDGASGVGILMEIAAQIKKKPINAGIDIVLFDAEDWGDNSGEVENSFCLGSQYWAKNLHEPNYRADFGILLDMVGAPNALFGYEGYSLSQAPNFLSMVWNTASDLGYSNYFKNFERGAVTDDHVYVMKETRIPMLDIIDTDLSTNSHFGKYWHTHSDNMDAIDRKTLKAVGHTLMQVISTY